MRVTSDSDTCATISIQADACPIHDLMYDIEYDGIFQSMTKIAAITVTPGFSTTVSTGNQGCLVSTSELNGDFGF